MLPAGTHQLAIAITAGLLVYGDPSSLQSDLVRYALIIIVWDLATTVLNSVGRRRTRRAANPRPGAAGAKFAAGDFPNAPSAG